MRYLVPVGQKHRGIVLEMASCICPPTSLHLNYECTKATSGFCGVLSEDQTQLRRAHCKVEQFTARLTLRGAKQLQNTSAGQSLLHFTKSQNGRGWKGPLWII